MIASMVAEFIGQGLAQIRQVALRQGERDINRRRLDDGCKRCKIGLPNEISDLDGGHADTPGDHRADGAIADLNFEILKLRDVGIDRRAPDVDLGSGILQRDHRGGVLGDELRVPRHVAFGLIEVGSCAGKHALDLFRLSLDGATVQGEEKVALLDHRAVAEVTPVISVSTRGFTATLAIGVTEPSASIRTGIVRFTAGATSTGTARVTLRRGAWATAPPVQKPPRMATTMPAAASKAATPNKIVRFFMQSTARPDDQSDRTPLLNCSCSYNSFWHTSSLLYHIPVRGYIIGRGFHLKTP